MISRRTTVHRARGAPVRAALLRRSARAVAAVSAPKRSFATACPGREMLRQRYFPDIVLTTSEGRQVRFYEDLLKDKIVVLNLMYANCHGICPVTTANLTRVQTLLREQVKRDVCIYSLTLKPEQDTPGRSKPTRRCTA